MRHGDDFDQSLFAGRHHRLQVAVQHRRERLLGLPFRMHRRHDLHAVECEGQLDIHRLLDPERAVIVEGRDALVDRYEEGPALRRDARDEVEDRRLGRALVPGRQRIALRLRHRGGGTERGGQYRKHRQGREKDAAIDSRKTDRSVSWSAPFRCRAGAQELGAPAINQSKPRRLLTRLPPGPPRFSPSRHRG